MSHNSIQLLSFRGMKEEILKECLEKLAIVRNTKNVYPILRSSFDTSVMGQMEWVKNLLKDDSKSYYFIVDINIIRITRREENHLWLNNSHQNERKYQQEKRGNHHINRSFTCNYILNQSTIIVFEIW